MTHGRTWSHARWIHTERDVDEYAGNGFITKREGHAECTKFENELQKEELVTYEVSKWTVKIVKHDGGLKEQRLKNVTTEGSLDKSL